MPLLRDSLIWASKNEWIESQFRRRRFARKAVSRFMPGETLDDALREATTLANQGLPTIVTALGENISKLDQAREVRDHYLEALAEIQSRSLDTFVSVKLTQLGLDLDPNATLENLRSLAAAAALRHNALWVDIEESPYVDRTLDLYEKLRGEFSNVGLCLQAYLYRSGEDLDRILQLDGTVRLVKGAYKESPQVAFPRKKDTDENFYLLSCRLAEHGARRAANADGKSYLRHGIATHDLPLLRRIWSTASAEGWGDQGMEIQMLFGIRAEEQRRLKADGRPVRVLISYGESWFPWYVRRLAERPANLGFVARSMLRL